MKNLVLPFLILVCLLLGFVFLLTNTPFLVNAMLPKLINDNMQGIHIDKFRCESQKSRLPNELMMKKVRMKLQKGFQVFEITANEIKIHNFLDFVRDHKLLRLSARGLNVKTKNISNAAGQLKVVIGLQNWKISFMEGAAFTQELNVGPYHFNKITGHFKTSPKKIVISDIDGNFYGGQVKGQLNFDYDPRFSYVVWSEFSGINPQEVKDFYPHFFSAIKGDLSGSLRVVGSNTVDIFTIIFRGDDEVKISPSAFLQMRGAFDETELSELKKLQESGAVLVAKKSDLHIQNSRGHKIMILFDMVEEQTGLILKGEFPFDWDEDYQSFLFPLQDK